MLVTQITFTYFLIYFHVLCWPLDDWHLYIGCLSFSLVFFVWLYILFLILNYLMQNANW